MSEELVVPDAEVVEAAPPSGTLFRTDDPGQVIQRATDIANALKPVLTQRNMVVRIQGKEHVCIEGWLTLGAMLGVTPVIAWTRPLDDGWEARALAQTLDGRTIGAGEGECRRSEGRWAKADDYAIRSMAQTRAQSKALASVLRFVVTLAGYSGTPAEEMPSDGASHVSQRDNARKGFASDKQRNFFERLLREAGGKPETIAAITGYAVEGLTTQQVSAAIDDLKARGAEAAKQLAEQANDWLSKQSDVPADTEGLEPAVEPDEEVGLGE